jgi:hypothetical protein
MAAVNLLESNWISIQEIFELVNRILTRIFVGLWPKQRADVLADDLKKLAKVFDTPEDPILLMKSRSMKRGAEGAIVLAYICAWRRDRLGEGELFPRSTSFGAVEFLREGEEICARHRVIVSPSAASTNSSMPVSLTPMTSASMPPPNTGATSSTPTAAADPEAEVA